MLQLFTQFNNQWLFLLVCGLALFLVMYNQSQTNNGEKKSNLVGFFRLECAAAAAAAAKPKLHENLKKIDEKYFYDGRRLWNDTN